MNAAIQQQINPPVTTNTLDFSDAKVKGTERAIDHGSVADRANFKDLILDSEASIKREREAKKNNDFSDAKTEEEFLQRLAESSKPKNEIKNTLDKDDFMKLFVAQLQHQDPLNPDDGAEMASKLAQFNSVEQMMNVNKTLEKMVEGQNSDRSTMMVNYLNKEITTSSGLIKLERGRLSTDTSFDFPTDAATSKLEIRDGTGALVVEKDLGTMKAGTHSLQWDGKNTMGQMVPNGAYTYVVTGKNLDGVDIPVKLTSKATILGVDLKDQDGGFYTQNGRVKFNDIVSLGSPGFNKAAAEQKAAPLAPTPGMSKGSASTSEDLEKMRAEGKLDIPQPAPKRSKEPPVAAVSEKKVEQGMNNPPS